MRSRVVLTVVATTFTLLLLNAIFSKANSADYTVVSDENKVVLAVHPYFSKGERKIFHVSRSAKKSIPIGVMIQNYGKGRISIEDVHVSSAKDEKIAVPRYTPYGERPLGAMAEREFFDDGDRLNSLFHDKYMPAEKSPRLKMNEVFYVPWLDAGESFYGLIYLDKRNKNYRPVKIKDLSNLTLGVRFRGSDLSQSYVARISLDGEETNSVEKSTDTAKKGHFKCEHPDCKKMRAEFLYEVNKALGNCYSKSLGKNGKGVGTVWGKRATAWVKFSKRGDYISHELLVDSGNSKLDKVTEAVARGMEHCELPPPDHGVSVSDTEPFYSAWISVGDDFYKSKDVSREDPQYIEYAKTVSENILQYFTGGPECAGGGTVLVKIDRMGNVKEIKFMYAPEDKKCGELALKAINKASPFPLPPKKLEKETFEEGFLLEFEFSQRGPKRDEKPEVK